MAIVLSAPGLLLRPWRLEDLVALIEAHRDPALRRWLATSLTDETQARQWLDTQAAGWVTATRFSFAVVPAGDDGPPLGHVVVKGETAEVGYWTAPQARGQGVAGRALEAVSQWALATLPVSRLELLHAADNHASCRVATKCGYSVQDLLPAAPPAFPTSGHRHVRSAATPGTGPPIAQAELTTHQPTEEGLRRPLALNELIGHRLVKAIRLAWQQPGEPSDLRTGPAHLAFDDGRGILFDCRSDWSLEWILTSSGDDWRSGYQYPDPDGRWIPRDASAEPPFAAVAGRSLSGGAPILNQVGEVTGLRLDFGGREVTLRTWQGELTTGRLFDDGPE
ncbi:GNAT family N-acetyltransferase [Paractinoplanes atraurantiacus]|uniref:Protein N-acetyltransferase, RimJ/RimL family n=1 Tax=Paractinoplanes atraurantiacus TaxID=1036182 RepID=A0A285IRN2_9ACTN|nr:GNAT family N-acetyltransferase [Actinoplanes atraurantiacus]SNY49621.1 Protein N-acetyltransferase, RimJ/RimL family [Actinoplanes atraurantiacus]